MLHCYLLQEDAVCSTQIPPIAGRREWGSYKITGLAIKRFAIDREGVVPVVGEGVTVSISGINIEFDSFNFQLEKVSCRSPFQFVWAKLLFLATALLPSSV